MKPDWHVINDERDFPKKSGRYLTITTNPSADDEGFMEISDFFKKDDVILTKSSQIDGTPEERLLDTLFNPDLEVRAEEDGFYALSATDEHYWRVYPAYWAEKPEFPDGVNDMEVEEDEDQDA